MHNYKSSPSIKLTVQEHDGHINKELNIFGSSSGVRSLSPTELGTVIEDFEHVLASLKRSGGLTHSFAGKGHRKFGGNRIPSYLNTSIALEPMNHPEF